MLAALILLGFLLALVTLLGAALFFLPVVLGLLALPGRVGILGLHPLGMVGLALALLGSTGCGFLGAGALHLLQRLPIRGRFARMRL